MERTENDKHQFQRTTDREERVGHIVILAFAKYALFWNTVFNSPPPPSSLPSLFCLLVINMQRICDIIVETASGTFPEQRHQLQRTKQYCSVLPPYISFGSAAFVPPLHILHLVQVSCRIEMNLKLINSAITMKFAKYLGAV